MPKTKTKMNSFEKRLWQYECRIKKLEKIKNKIHEHIRNIEKSLKNDSDKSHCDFDLLKERDIKKLKVRKFYLNAEKDSIQQKINRNKACM